METKPILIVEDDSDIRESLAEVLRFAGYVVYEASHGQDALENLKRIPPPALVILDAMMPVMDGPTFYKKFRALAEYESIPVVLFSAVGHKINLEGLAARINKPGNIDEILDIVSKCCEV